MSEVGDSSEIEINEERRHRMSDLVCSEERCDIHDVGMVVDDEGGSRPSGRNPWDGMCLRIDALNRISAVAVLGDSLTKHYSDRPEFADVPEDLIREIVREEIRKSVGYNETRRSPRGKTGGTLL